MGYLKCFKKQINIILYILIVFIMAFAIIWGFTHELFEPFVIKNHNTILDVFDRCTIRGKEIDTSFSFHGLVEFTNRVLNNFNNNELLINYKEYYDIIYDASVISTTRSIMTLLILMFVCFAFFMICQLFNFRMYSNFLTSLLPLIFIVVIKNIAIKDYYTPQFIYEANGNYTFIVVLFSMLVAISLIQIIFNLYLNNENQINNMFCKLFRKNINNK